jgi:hypothetical protein
MTSICTRRRREKCPECDGTANVCTELGTGREGHRGTTAGTDDQGFHRCVERDHVLAPLKALVREPDQYPAELPIEMPGCGRSALPQPCVTYAVRALFGLKYYLSPRRGAAPA